jgi:hypothetical protein
MCTRGWVDHISSYPVCIHESPYAYRDFGNANMLDYIAYSGEYSGVFSFSSENLNNSQVCRVFASKEFAECSS